MNKHTIRSYVKQNKHACENIRFKAEIFRNPKLYSNKSLFTFIYLLITHTKLFYNKI